MSILEDNIDLLLSVESNWQELSIFNPNVSSFTSRQPIGSRMEPYIWEDIREKSIFYDENPLCDENQALYLVKSRVMLLYVPSYGISSSIRVFQKIIRMASPYAKEFRLSLVGLYKASKPEI